MRVLVTGGAGFIGSSLCRKLVRVPGMEQVSVIDDLSSGDARNLDGVDVELHEASILDTDRLAAAAAGADAIVHLAARPSVPMSLADPVATNAVNVTGSLAVLEVARRTDAYVVVASSSSVYGDTPVSPKHEDLPTRPLSPYGVSKVATEQYAAAYLHSFGVRTLALRFFNVYGPYQPATHAYAAVVPAFVSAALAGRPLPMFGDGRQVRDFVFVDTVIEVLLDAVLRRVCCPCPVNLASGTATDLAELVAALADVVGHELAVERLPARPGDIRDSRDSQALFQNTFPDIAPVDLRTGLAATLAWFRSLPR